MSISLKKRDDRPKILWRLSLEEDEQDKVCKMQNTPLEIFICTQIYNCKYECIQKVQQLKNQEYVRKQKQKMINRIQDINNNGNNGKKILKIDNKYN